MCYLDAGLRQEHTHTNTHTHTHTHTNYLKLTAFPLQKWLWNAPQRYVKPKFPVLYFFCNFLLSLHINSCEMQVTVIRLNRKILTFGVPEE
jgi:hypothetical protein